jgi:hypothetical protein
MAGMEGLGRDVDFIPIASGQAFKLRGASAASILCTGADTFTITVSPTFGGAYVSPGALINHYYQRADTNGTHAWTRVAQTAANTVVQASAYTSLFEILTSQIPAPNAYVKVTASAAGLVTVILHDLVAQRRAVNLEVLGA